MRQDRPAISIIVPTYREAPNLHALTERIFAATRGAGLDAELIIVDDNSSDGTAEIVAELAKTFPVRILVRTHERGLSSAVLHGFAQAEHDVLVVLDADLSHPPEAIPELVNRIHEDRAEFVLGSRYAPGGRTTKDWTWLRRSNSRLATVLARPLTPVRDPMSGFFALPRSTLERADALHPVGYKIALEIIVKARCRHCVEIPIEFAQRAAGRSKLTLGERLRYLRHLVRLYSFELFRARRRSARSA